MHAELLSHVQLFGTPWTMSMGFPRQEYWHGLLLPSPRDLPNRGIEPRSCALQADSLLSEPPGKPTVLSNIKWEKMGFPGDTSGKECTCQCGRHRDTGSIPGLGRSPVGGHGNLLWYSCLENPHGQRSLMGHSPWGCKVSSDCAHAHKYW